MKENLLSSNEKCKAISNVYDDVSKLLKLTGITEMEYGLFLASKELDHLRVMFDTSAEDNNDETAYKATILCLLTAFANEYKTDGYSEVSYFDICKGLSVYIETQSMSGNDFQQDFAVVMKIYDDFLHMSKSDFFNHYNEILYYKTY